MAQSTPSPTPDPKDKKPKVGFIRFWNMLPKDQGSLALVKNDGSAEGEVLLNALPQNGYASYNGEPPARYSLKVIRTAEPNVPLKTFDVLLRDKVYVTFLASLIDGKAKVEMIDDTYDPETTVTGRLVIYQNFPETNVVVAANTRQTSKVLGPGGTETMEGFPLRRVEFQMTATHANGKTESWTAEVDFAKVRHASLLVVPDPYGRFRPRVNVDGRAAFGPAN